MIETRESLRRERTRVKSIISLHLWDTRLGQLSFAMQYMEGIYSISYKISFNNTRIATRSGGYRKNNRAIKQNKIGRWEIFFENHILYEELLKAGQMI